MFKIDFIGIGAQKSATSWIDKCLREHPEIYIPPQKELHFFNRNFEKGLDYFKSFFKDVPKNLKKGEITPEYINKLEVAERIYKHFPQVKLIACLRNPIDRAYSQYNFSKRSWPDENFEQVLQNYSDIREKGFYCKQLKQYLRFFPKEQTLILIYEDIKKDPLKFIQKIYAFLGVNENFVPQSLYKKVNTGKWIIHFPKTRKFLHRVSWGKTFLNFLRKLKIDKLELAIRTKRIEKIKKLNIRPKEIKKETRQFVRNIYNNDIKNLEKLIGRNLSFWN